MEGKPDTGVRIPASINKNFFEYWLDSITLLFKLTDKEKIVLACLLRKRYKLSKNIVNSEELLSKVLFSDEVKAEVAEECGMDKQYLQVVLSKLRQKGAIKDGSIHPKLIPNLTHGQNTFIFMYRFDLDDNNAE